MALSISIVNGGATPIPGLDMVAIGTITWDDSSLVTGEPIGTVLASYFSEIDAIMPAGCSAIGLAGYVPAFVFTPGAATSTDGNILAVLARVPAIADAGEAAQPLEPSDALNVGALGTTQVVIFGKAA